VSVARFVAGRLPSARDPGGIYITPEQDVRSVRTAPLEDRHRLLIITGEHFTPRARHVTERWERLLAWTAERFPGVEITYRWATQDNGTTDQLPYVGLFHPGARHVYVATGFGGWGTSSGIMAGHLLAASIVGKALPWADLYDPRRLHPGREAGPLLKCRPPSPDISSAIGIRSPPAARRQRRRLPSAPPTAAGRRRRGRSRRRRRPWPVPAE
jgi:glycine/D-amino acid oxidase-like deaminating enzyme